MKRKKWFKKSFFHFASKTFFVIEFEMFVGFSHFANSGCNPQSNNQSTLWRHDIGQIDIQQNEVQELMNGFNKLECLA